jgi:hypothetical protein
MVSVVGVVKRSLAHPRSTISSEEAPLHLSFKKRKPIITSALLVVGVVDTSPAISKELVYSKT